MTSTDLELIMTGKTLIPCLADAKKQKISNDCYEITTPFLDSHNDYITLYVTYLNEKLVMVDEDTIPDLIDYSSDDVGNIIRRYVSEQAPKECHITRNELVYDLDQTQDISNFTHYLDMSYHSFISFILETSGIAKLFNTKDQ